MTFDFFMPVKVISGKGAVLKSGEEFRKKGKSFLIVTGGSSATKSGALEDVCSVLKEIRAEYKVYDKIGPNPLIENCHEAAQIAIGMNADCIIGIGGGSPMDASKAVSIYAVNAGCSPEDIYAFPSGTEHLPLILIGTTSGTGSEVSGVSVLTNGATGRKKSIGGIYADISFGCPEYTNTMTYSVTVSTAVDALSHAVEGWFSPKISDSVKVFAVKGLPMIYSALKKLVETKELPDEEGREKLYYGSLYAGMVLNACGTAFPHPMGYVLTEDYGFPHGFACGAFLPYLAERGEKYAPEKAEELFDLISSDLKEFTDLLKKAVDISKVSMTEEEALEFSNRWENQKNFKIVPGGYTKEDAFELLKKLFVK